MGLDSCAADVWAVGTLMYLLLTDEMPVPMLSAREVGDARQFLRPIRPPRTYNVTVDAGLEAVIFRCLASDAQDRYPNAQELLEDLEKWDPDFAPPGASASIVGTQTKGTQAPEPDEDLRAEAHNALDAALELARDPTQLWSAADLLEEAMSKDPALRERYGSQLGLWRRGIMTAPAGDLSRLPSLRSSAQPPDDPDV